MLNNNSDTCKPSSQNLKFNKLCTKFFLLVFLTLPYIPELIMKPELDTYIFQDMF